MNLSQYIGESRSHRVKLTLDGQPFNPAEHTLVFTAKWSPEEADTEAIFQKQSYLGITTESSSGAFFANISIVPADTSDDLPGENHYDIRALHNTTGVTRIVATGRLLLRQPITREPHVSTPVHTEQPIAPDVALAQMHAGIAAAQLAQSLAEDAAQTAQTAQTEASSSATTARQQAEIAVESASIAASAAETATTAAELACQMPIALLRQDAVSATIIFGASLNPRSSEVPYPSLILTLP